MELDQLKTIWASNDSSLEQRIRLDEQHILQIQTQKTASQLRPLLVQRVIECLFHLAAILFLAEFLVKNLNDTPYMLSAFALLAFYFTTFVNALQQVQLIRTIDFSSNLATLQRSLLLLQTHIVQYVKLAVLFIPSFLAYPVIASKLGKMFHIQWLTGFDILKKSNGHWWMIEFWAFIVLVPLGVWFYYQVNHKNIHKTWVRYFIERSSGRRVVMALESLREVEELK